MVKEDLKDLRIIKGEVFQSFNFLDFQFRLQTITVYM
jgi:hypothetical protein